MKTSWGADAPFVFVNVDGLGNSGTLIFTSFSDYVKTLADTVTVKLPEVMTAAERVIDEAQDVQKYAEPQFERLDIVSKGKAVMAMSFNMKAISNMPGLIKQALEDLKDDLEQIKVSGEEMKNNMPKMKSDGASCNGKGLTNPVACHKEIYGPIKYTRAQRNVWEARMRDRFRAKGQTFQPSNYPTTDMIDS